MGLLIFLLIIGLFFPILWIPLILFGGLFLLFLPFKFTVDSLFNLFTIPGQIYKIATNPDLRKNHALEHATVNILEKEFGYKNLAGYATENGFYIIGVNNTLEVTTAAKRGLDLMIKGNSQLAIHNKCGTSLIAANFISAIIFLILLLYLGYFSIMSMVIAILLSHLVGPFLGRMVQKNFTTTSEVKEINIVSSHIESGDYWKQPSKVFVKTEKIPYIN
ncbi:MAG: DUF6391 domain-containing protein [Bacillota bacterium]